MNIPRSWCHLEYYQDADHEFYSPLATVYWRFPSTLNLHYDPTDFLRFVVRQDLETPLTEVEPDEGRLDMPLRREFLFPFLAKLPAMFSEPSGELLDVEYIDEEKNAIPENKIVEGTLPVIVLGVPNLEGVWTVVSWCYWQDEIKLFHEFLGAYSAQLAGIITYEGLGCFRGPNYGITATYYRQWMSSASNRISNAIHDNRSMYGHIVSAIEGIDKASLVADALGMDDPNFWWILTACRRILINAGSIYHSADQAPMERVEDAEAPDYNPYPVLVCGVTDALLPMIT
jgi:hypothetical protein